MKENKQTFINTLFWVFGAIYLGELLLQIMVRQGLEIQSYKHYLQLQFVLFLPLGIFAYLVMKTTLSKYISSLATVLSVLMINFVIILQYSFDDPWAYVQENREETIQAFTGNTILLLPLLIGFVAAQLVALLLPKVMKGKTVKEVASSTFKSIKKKVSKSPKKKVATKKKVAAKSKAKTGKKTTKTKSTRKKKTTANAAKKTTRKSKKTK